MTPKEKAIELVYKHFDYVEALSAFNQIENAKQCAIITVNEIIFEAADEYTIKWFEKVKAEIKKIEI